MRNVILFAAVGGILLAAALIPLTYDRLVLKISPKDGHEITLDASRGTAP